MKNQRGEQLYGSTKPTSICLINEGKAGLELVQELPYRPGGSSIYLCERDKKV